MILAFTLSMPSNNAWNGRWTGEDRLYCIVKNLGRTKKAEERARQILEKGYYTYNFGDGWQAAIDVKEVDSKEAAKLRRKSQGFCGYGWMVNSILDKGLIEA